MASVASRCHSLLPPNIDVIRDYIAHCSSGGGLCRNTELGLVAFDNTSPDGSSGDYAMSMSGQGSLRAPASPSKLSPLVLGQQPNRSPSPLSGSDGMASAMDGTTTGGASSSEDIFEPAGTESQFTATSIDDDFLTPQRYLFPQQGDAFNAAPAGADQRYWSDDDREQRGGHMGQFIQFAMSESPTGDPPPHPQAPLYDAAHMFHPGPGPANWDSSIHGEASSSYLQIPLEPQLAAVSSGNSSGSEASSSEAYAKASIPTRRVAGGKVAKKKSGDGGGGNFVIMTPTSINAQSGKPNPFECFDAAGNSTSRTSRGRKGPLASTAKKNALQVRRQGACFCCHARKVKCDMERPCRSCTRLMVHVPRVVCWQFQDFLGILLPDFLRGHFRKEEMAKFMEQHVGEPVTGQDCRVELYSGPWFGAKLALQARFFDAKTPEALRHWHSNAAGGRVDLRCCDSVPIGMDLAASAQRDDLRRRVRVYIQDIIHEPAFAEQVTDTLKSTQLPTKTLRVVQRYANRTNSPIVKKALSIYAMHYIMTRHLCLTRDSILSLQPTGLVPQDTPWVTSRVLSRQVKATVDDLMNREVQQLFELFSRSLKPKARREWAPCLAAFLVLCLFMEGVEAAGEAYVISQNEIRMRALEKPELERNMALDTCREVENMPFRQFAYQFHHISMTHTKDPNSKAFNPLFDASLATVEELDEPALELVHGLKEMFYGSDWLDMQFLADDEMILNREDHPFPLDPAYMYNGRLLAKFLLSFTDERYIFGAND